MNTNYYGRDIPPKVKLYVLRRDSYMCRRCGSTENLHPHHINFRSTGGNHHPDNLITLCAHCHRQLHDGNIWVYIDERGNAFFGGSRADLLHRYK